MAGNATGAKFQLAFGIFGFVLLLIIISLASLERQLSTVAVLAESAHTAAKYIPKPKIPSLSNIYNPFRVAAHKPPEQANSTSGDAKWYSDWKWMNPFSSSITLDENRAVLPPLTTRPPVYTYYDTADEEDADIRKAQEELILVWRRAWWAKGFKPVVLSRADATQNPLYESVQRLALPGAIDTELVRWSAWGHMGSGILADWLLLPMAPYEDDLLSYLRRGEYPKLTRYEGLGSGLFCGEKRAINAALTQAINDKNLKEASSLLGAVPPQMFDVDPEHDGIAFYDSSSISTMYKSISEKLKVSRAEGLTLLAQLINSHLHTTWQNTFTSGISALTPLEKRMSTLVNPALQLARNLSRCPESPQIASCPPNRLKCHTCFSSLPMRVDQASCLRNTSSLFTIGIVPHTYSTALLNHRRDSVDMRFIRREMARDVWLFAVTKDLLGWGPPGPERLVRFKEAVASNWGVSHTLWLNAEDSVPQDLDWVFGFIIPQVPVDNGKSETPVPGPERRPPPPKPDGPVVDEKDAMRETELLEMAREKLKTKGKDERRILAATEAWSLGDAEAWRFVKAFGARRTMERLKWVEEERAFVGINDG